MINLLKTDVATVIKNRRSHIIPVASFPDPVQVVTSVVSATNFDIRDCKGGKSITCGHNDADRAATYLNPSGLPLRFIEYDEYIGQFFVDDAHDWSYELRRPDYIVISDGSNHCFLLHEVSTGKFSSKKSKGINQLRGALHFLMGIPAVAQYISTYGKKECYISATGCDDPAPATPMLPGAPEGVAAGFMSVYNIQPNPARISDKTIERHGFTLWAGNLLAI